MGNRSLHADSDARTGRNGRGRGWGKVEGKRAVSAAETYVVAVVAATEVVAEVAVVAAVAVASATAVVAVVDAITVAAVGASKWMAHRSPVPDRASEDREVRAKRERERERER